ncbi:MAG: hypothetical protein WAK01_17045 [Methylocystis sp.]
MGGISVRLHRKFSTRASRGAVDAASRPLREMRGLLETSEPRGFVARASGGALRFLLALLLWTGCFLAGAVAFGFFCSRW